MSNSDCCLTKSNANGNTSENPTTKNDISLFGCCCGVEIDVGVNVVFQLSLLLFKSKTSESGSNGCCSFCNHRQLIKLLVRFNQEISCPGKLFIKEPLNNMVIINKTGNTCDVICFFLVAALASDSNSELTYIV